MSRLDMSASSRVPLTMDAEMSLAKLDMLPWTGAEVEELLEKTNQIQVSLYYCNVHIRTRIVAVHMV